MVKFSCFEKAAASLERLFLYPHGEEKKTFFHRRKEAIPGLNREGRVQFPRTFDKRYSDFNNLRANTYETCIENT